jgi:hypothetical protein
LRLIFHPSAKKHVAAMAILNVVVKDSAKVQRSGNRDTSSVKATERQRSNALRMMQAVNQLDARRRERVMPGMEACPALGIYSITPKNGEHVGHLLDA